MAWAARCPVSGTLSVRPPLRQPGATGQAAREETQLTTAGQPAGGNSARRSPAGLADVIDTVSGKGLVIGAYVRGSLVSIELLAIEARIEIASADTCLRFAEAVSRLDIPPENEGLPVLSGDMPQSGVTHMTMGALEAAGEKPADLAPDPDQDQSPAPAAGAGTRRTEMVQPADADLANPPEPAKGIYVYGILPGDIEMTRERTGVGDPPGRLRIVRTEKLAAPGKRRRPHPAARVAG